MRKFSEKRDVEIQKKGKKGRSFDEQSLQKTLKILRGGPASLNDTATKSQCTRVTALRRIKELERRGYKVRWFLERQGERGPESRLYYVSE